MEQLTSGCNSKTSTTVVFRLHKSCIKRIRVASIQRWTKCFSSQNSCSRCVATVFIPLPNSKLWPEGGLEMMKVPLCTRSSKRRSMNKHWNRSSTSTVNSGSAWKSNSKTSTKWTWRFKATRKDLKQSASKTRSAIAVRRTTNSPKSLRHADTSFTTSVSFNTGHTLLSLESFSAQSVRLITQKLSIWLSLRNMSTRGQSSRSHSRNPTWYRLSKSIRFSRTSTRRLTSWISRWLNQTRQKWKKVSSIDELNSKWAN